MTDPSGESRVHGQPTRRSVAAGLALAGAAFGLSSLACGRRRPDVLFVSIDTLRADHVSSYGYRRRTTPEIDRLAAVSVRFERAWSQAPWTLPSLASLLSSRYPGELGIRDMRSVLPPDVPLLGEALGASGYDTGAIVSASLCGRKRGFDRGFATFDDSNAKGHFAVTSPALTDLALAFVDHARSRPYFLWVHYFDPHHAYLEHPDHRFGAGDAYRGPVAPGQDINDLFALNAGGRLAASDLQRLRDLYDSEIAFTDRQVGRLLDHLRLTGRFEDTLILLTADHGEEFGDHGGLSHTYTLHEEVLRVPLLVKRPRGGDGIVTHRPVALVDIAPTVLAELGLPPIAGAVGRPLFGEQPADGGRPIYFETTQEKNDLRGVLEFPRKLVVDLRTGATHHHDLGRDPGEQRNVVASEDPEFNRIGRRLARWLRERRTVASAQIELGDEEQSLLRSLGYL